MKKILLLIIITLTISCKNDKSDTEFRDEIDRIKKEKLPNEEYSVTTFELDSIKEVKFFSEIKSTSSAGLKSISIKTEYSKSHKLLGKIENGPFRNAEFFNQKIISDKDGNENLYYLLKDENGAFIYQIQYKNKSLVKTRIESNYPEWNELEAALNKE